MTTITRQLETYDEVRDFVFTQLDHEFLNPGSESLLNEQTWALIHESDKGDGVWIITVEHKGDGTFVGGVGFHYYDDENENHWIGLQTTDPKPGSEAVRIVATACMMIMLGVIEQPTRETYEQITRDLPLTRV